MLRRNGSQCSLCFFGQCCGVSATSECQMLFSVPCRKHGENLAQSLADVLQIRTRSGGERKWRLLLIAFTLRLQELTGARNGETFLIKKLLNSQNILNVLAAIHPLPSAAFHGLELGELGFPKAQHVGGQVTEASHFADTEISFSGIRTSEAFDDLAAARLRGLMRFRLALPKVACLAEARSVS